jgi:hypothetical protein
VAPKLGGGARAEEARVPLAATYGAAPIGAAVPEVVHVEEAWVPLATTCGVVPTGVAVPEVPARGLRSIGSGMQSSSDRKSKEDEGGSEISVKGKEDSSTNT